MIFKFLESLGRSVLSVAMSTGSLSIFFKDSIKAIFKPPFRYNLILEQMVQIGFNSLFVIGLTAFATGSVLALQTYQGFIRFGAESMVGSVVALSMVRELSPMLTSIMVAARAGSAMAAELGSMKVTEQIDALYTLSTDPLSYLVAPRILATVCMMPALVLVSNLVGILGGAFIGIVVLGSNPVVFFDKTFDILKLNDIFSGLIKALVFALIVSSVSCYHGIQTENGAEGVGKSTTDAVVLSSVLIFVFDYILTSFLFTV